MSDIVDVDELPDGPPDSDVYRRLLELVEPDRSSAAGADYQFCPPDLRGDTVWAFRFQIDDEWHFWHYCPGCEEWERATPQREHHEEP